MNTSSGSRACSPPSPTSGGTKARGSGPSRPCTTSCAAPLRLPASGRRTPATQAPGGHSPIPHAPLGTEPRGSGNRVDQFTAVRTHSGAPTTMRSTRSGRSTPGRRVQRCLSGSTSRNTSSIRWTPVARRCPGADGAEHKGHHQRLQPDWMWRPDERVRLPRSPRDSPADAGHAGSQESCRDPDGGLQPSELGRPPYRVYYSAGGAEHGPDGPQMADHALRRQPQPVRHLPHVGW